MKLTEATRATTPSGVRWWTCDSSAWWSGSKSGVSSKTSRQAPVRCAGAPPRCGSMISESLETHGTVVSRDVEDDPQASAGPEDAVDLGERLVTAEPVEGLADRDRIDARVVERDRLRGSRVRRHAGKRPLERGAHLGDGLDRDHGRPGADQQRGQLPGAGGEVEDDPAPA